MVMMMMGMKCCRVIMLVISPCYTGERNFSVHFAISTWHTVKNGFLFSVLDLTFLVGSCCWCSYGEEDVNFANDLKMRLLIKSVGYESSNALCTT